MHNEVGKCSNSLECITKRDHQAFKPKDKTFRETALVGQFFKLQTKVRINN